MYAIAISLLITIAAYVFIGFYYLGSHRWPSSYANKKVLFVTAHPDDECMFFGPTIRYFKDIGEVFLLCLTTGNNAGLGEVRGEELQRSACKLGFKPQNLHLVDSEELPDDPNTDWSREAVATEVSRYAKVCDADIVVTFDKYGVSGHANHRAASLGVEHAFHGKLMPDNTLLYQLESVNLLRKYSSFLDCFVSSTYTVYSIASLRDIVNVQAAMKCHYTQITWFRKLYVVFSRYMIVNTLRSVPV